MAEITGKMKRADKARQTRKRILDAAREQFIVRGYGATTLQDIAGHAGVAVQTIYFTFGNKRTLLKELADVAVAGDDEPVATMDRPWFRDGLAAPTADAQLRGHVHGASEVLGRVAQLTEVFRTAVQTDPEVTQLWQYDVDPRYTVQLAAARALVSKPDTRPGISAEHAADLLFGLLSPELYLVLVRDRGWSQQQWEHWAYETLRTQLVSGGAAG